MCASGRYNESQTTASGSQTSLVLLLPHQSEVAYRLNRDMQEKGFFSRDCLPAGRCSLPRDHRRGGARYMEEAVEGPLAGARDTEEAAETGGGGARCRYNPLDSLICVAGSRAIIPFLCLSWFSLDFRESKPKCLSPNSFSFMAEITPHRYESRCGNTRDVREPDAL